jgi:hypothetical protein
MTWHADEPWWDVAHEEAWCELMQHHVEKDDMMKQHATMKYDVKKGGTLCSVMWHDKASRMAWHEEAGHKEVRDERIQHATAILLPQEGVAITATWLSMPLIIPDQASTPSHRMTHLHTWMIPKTEDDKLRWAVTYHYELAVMFKQGSYWSRIYRSLLHYSYTSYSRAYM